MTSIKRVLKQLDLSVHFAEIPSELRCAIHRLCADYVGGAWAQTRKEEIKIVHLRGGTSNLLFLCRLPKEHPSGVVQGVQAQNDESTPRELLLRVYFNPNTENQVLEESVVFTLLAERKMGPKLYGIFGEGRLEEYIHSRALHTSEIRIPVVSSKIARILAQIHQLLLPIGKRPVYLRDSMRKWMSEIRSIYAQRDSDEVVVAQSSQMEKTFTLDEMEAEIELVVRCTEQSPSPVVFCHNDYQEGNILFKSSDLEFETADFTVIDYEYSSYNYRAFDIANHFCEWTFDYHSNSSYPYFAWTQDSYPNEEQQAIFARSYLQETNNRVPTGGDIKSLLEEVKAFVPVSHFFWGVWSLLLAETSPIQFGFAEYARCRLEIYFNLRADLLKLLRDGGIYNGVL